MKSFKQGIQSGELKRADAMKVPYQSIHVEPGFNLRTATESLTGEAREEAKANDESLFQHIMNGGQLPPLEVRPREDGGVWLVDGHRRYEQLGRALAAGAPIDWISIVAFTGNDADRTARILTSQENRKLLPLEVAQGYKRLSAFGKTPDEIAAMVGKTRQHVDQLLTLANANSDVHAAVKDGKISAAGAVSIVRKHGEAAGAEIAGQVDKAAAQGKARVTAGTMKPKPLPAAVVDGVVNAAEAVLDGLNSTHHETLAAVKAGNRDPSTGVMVSAFDLQTLLDAHTAVIDARAAEKAKAAAKAAKASQKELVE